MATGPQPGDLIIRNTVNLQFEIVVASDGRRIGGPFNSFAAAHARARRTAGNGARLWQQSVDVRGRSLGRPVPVLAMGPQLKNALRT